MADDGGRAAEDGGAATGAGGAPLALDRFLPYRLSVLANTVSSSIARVYARRFGLSVPAWRVMAVLGMAPPLTAGDICGRTAMDKVRVSRAVSRLLRAGLVERRVDEDDRRRAFLTLSRKGRRVYGEIIPLALAAEAQLLAALGDDEARQLDRLIDKLQSRAEDLARQSGVDLVGED
ncbi:MAG TPA: MarR family winged helix-turn-helix transcriptional regulator [Alphaproteobacteria bacterium]